MLVILFLAIVIPHYILAQIPQTMSYQGVLTGADSNPVPDGTISLTFKLYNVVENGDMLWQETQDVTVTNGIFNTILGSVTPLNLPFDEQYWLGITIGSDAELTPRTALTASPYSLNSHSTIAETEPGQGLTIRNLNGEATHQFDSNGDVTHTGVGTFLGGIVVGDTIIASGLEEIKAKNFTLRNNLTEIPEIGIYSIGTTAGINGVSTSGNGVWGKSESGNGVFGSTNSSSFGGVVGVGTGGPGVVGSSSTGTGVQGKGSPGLWAFESQLKVDDVPQASNQDRFLVWDTDYIIKYRSLPLSGAFNGILQDKAFVMRSGELEVFRVNTDGTSFHKGIETFDDDVILKGTSGKGIKLVDVNGVTLAGFGRRDEDTGQRFGVYGKAENPGDLAGVFDGDLEVNGEIVASSFHIVDGNGNTLTSFNADGTSSHTGLETYLGGVDLPDNNPENSTSNVKAGKFIPGANQLSPLKLLMINAPDLDGKNLSLITATPNEPTIWGYTERIDGAAIFGQSTNISNTSPATWGVHLGGGAGVVGEVRNTSSNYPGVWAIQYGTGSALLVDHQHPSIGNIFTGRSGGVNQVRIDKTGKGFFNGGTQTGGADVAEAFEVEGLVEEYEPGDVLVISIQSDRTITKSSVPYSTLVAGVYATKPGVLLTERNIDDQLEDTVPLGVMGVIPTKVSNENGPIYRGDLLVTSSLPGYAMKGTDQNKLIGSVLGKALENFDGNGTGVIKVLVNSK
jgi:hypothetical protein